MLIATVIAIVIGFLGLGITEENVVIRILGLLGGMTIPLLFIILGGNIYNDFKAQGRLQVFEVAKFVLVKNFVFPLVFLGFLFYFKDLIPVHIVVILVIQSAVPPVTAVPLVVERAGGNRSIVNQFIVASFIVSLFSIPFVMYLFEMLF